MVREPQLDNSAPWKQRFRAPIIARARIARLAPTRGLVMSNQSGIYQLYTECAYRRTQATYGSF